MSEAKNIVEAVGLTKAWGDIVAVDHIDFEIQSGEIFGFLGPNGAGKSTTIKMLCTLYLPSDGKAAVGGYDILTQGDEVRKIIGYVPQDITVDGRLTGYENLDFQASLYGLKGKEKEDRINEMLKLVQLGQRAGGLVDTYSGGMRRRLEIARGLLVEPQLLFLDEPSLGLDPVSRKSIWEHVSKLQKKKGKERFAIFMSTHYMEEADKLCNRVGIIDRGRIVALDTPTALKQQIGGQIIEIDVDPQKVKRAFKRLEQFGKEDQTIRFIDNINQVGDGTISIEVKDTDTAVPKVFKIASEGGFDVQQVRLRAPTLEDVFIYYTGKTLRDEDETDAMGFIKSQISKRMRSL
ncbi:MAG TPA: ATP-binding cassette domain-containing protein [Candidatus Deferrimicrobium sp.]|nr:ATP-binding cassette domain-containing protein [Candidatus Deferrimicrobium sp.]